jgi:iron complex outermembrane receptor protein
MKISGGDIPRLSSLALAVCTGLGGATVWTFAEAQVTGLEEVVVTARYREENIQTTPISITAFTGEELELRSIENLEDIGLVIPNAYFRRNVSNFGPNNTVGLRGLNQIDFSYSFEPTVGIYIDDVYHSTITGSDMDLIDLDRVEVLRGPQGTLFGKNSLGGSMRLISSKPQGEDSGSVEVTFGDYERLDVKAMGDFTLVDDRLFMRIVGVAKEREGHGASLDFTCEMIRRGTPELAGIGDGVAGATLVSPGGPPFFIPTYAPVMSAVVGDAADNAFSLPAARDVLQGDGCEIGKLGGTSSDAGRVMLRFLPSDRLEINLAADVTNSRDDPNVDALLTQHGGVFDMHYNNSVVFPTYGISYIADDRFVTGDPYTNYATFADPVEGQQYPRDSVYEGSGFSAVLDYQINDNMGAKIILADRSYDNEWTSDSDKTPFGLVQTHYLQNHDQQQAELQLNGTLASDRLAWTAGLFWFDSESRAYNTTEFGGFDTTGLLPNFVANDRYGTENTSMFFHVSYDVTDSVSISGGARYTDEEKFNIFAHPPGIVIDDPLLFGDSRTDWKASVDFTLNENVFLYGQIATGFTSEGATPRIFTPGQLRSIGGEELTSYEVGAKMDLLDNRLRINAALYTSDWDPRSRQVGGVTQCDAPSDPNPTPYRLAGGVCPAGTAFAGGGGLPWFFYDNVPGSLDGFEVELTATPIDNLLISYSAGTNEYENDDLDPTSGTYIDPSYLDQPEWNMSAGLQYTLQFAGGGTLTPRLDAFYQSHENSGPSNRSNVCPEECVPSYTVFNGRLTYLPPAGDWSLSVSATNLTDKFYWQQLGAAVTATGGFPNGRSAVASRPREWAVSFQKDF